MTATIIPFRAVRVHIWRGADGRYGVSVTTMPVEPNSPPANSAWFDDVDMAWDDAISRHERFGYTMASVSLGNGAETGDEGDNMGVVVPWSPPDAFEGVTAAHLLTIQGRIDQQRPRADPQAKAWVGIIVADVLGLSPHTADKSDRAKINALLRSWIGNGALLKTQGKDDKGNPNGAAAFRRAGKGTAAALEAVKAGAADRAESLRATIQALQAGGVTSLASIAAALNDQGIVTARGGRWHASSVRNLVARLNG